MKKNAAIPVDWLFTQLKEVLNDEEIHYLIDSLDQTASVSVRINPVKFSERPSLEGVPWCTHGYYLNKRPSFTHDPAFHVGAYYVQEASSMFVDYITKEFVKRHKTNEPLVVLDLCAAPGGKATLLSSALLSKGVVVANETNTKRFSVLEENCIKWGLGNIIPVNEMPEKFESFPNYFDMVLVDAPCSGEGLWRKDKEAINEWSEENVKMCCQRQQKILNSAWQCLKPGGWLIYSTCTFNTNENEENVKWMFHELADAKPVIIEIPKEWGIVNSENTGTSSFRFFPHKITGEGFFAAVLQKEKSDYTPVREISSFKLQKPGEPEKVFSVEKLWWKNDESVLMAASAEVIPVLNRLAGLRISDKIFEVFNTQNNSFSPFICWNADLRGDYFTTLPLSPVEAIGFLMCDTSRMNKNMPERETLLACYNGRPLGFIRRIGNSIRIDYPRNWRILKAGTPQPAF